MTNKTTITIDLDTKKATKGIDDLGKNIKEKGSSSSKSFSSSIGQSLKSVNLLKVAAVAAGAALAAAFASKKFIEAANKQESAINSLNASLARIGQFSRATSLDLQNFASALQKTSVFGDEVVLEQLALAQSLGATAAQSKVVVSAATELATALNIDLRTATQQVGKTFSGTAGELGLLIPELKSLTKEQLIAGGAAEIINAKFKGLAEAAIQTSGGGLKQLNNTIGDTFESIGFLITQNPIFLKAVKSLNEVFLGASKFLDDNRLLFINLVNSGINFAIDGLIIFGNVIEKTLRFFSDSGLVQTIINIFKAISEASSITGGDIDKFLGQSVRQVALIFRTFFDLVQTGFQTIITGGLLVVKAFDAIANAAGKELGISDALDVELEASLAKMDKFASDAAISGAAIFGDGALAENVGTFAQEIATTFGTLQESLVNPDTGKTFTESLLDPFKAENLAVLSDNMSAFTNSISSSAAAAGAKTNTFSIGFQKSIIDIGASLKTGLVTTVSSAFQQFGASLVSGTFSMQDFAKSVFGILGDVAIQIGTTAIAAGIAIDSIGALSGTQSVIAGAALIAIGGAIKALSGGGSGVGVTPVAGSGLGGSGVDNPTVISEPAADTERQQSTNVQVVVNGDILDNGEETARRIASLLSDNFDSQGISVRGRA